MLGYSATSMLWARVFRDCRRRRSGSTAFFQETSATAAHVAYIVGAEADVRPDNERLNLLCHSPQSGAGKHCAKVPAAQVAVRRLHMQHLLADARPAPSVRSAPRLRGPVPQHQTRRWSNSPPRPPQSLEHSSATPRRTHLLLGSSVRSEKVVMKLRPVRFFTRYVGHSKMSFLGLSRACTPVTCSTGSGL